MKARALTDHDKYIGQRIREARLARGLSQEDLANMIGTSYQQIQKYENGKNRVHSARIERLVSALNRPLAYFFPNATDVRSTSALSAFLTSKDVHELARLWPYLGQSDRKLVLSIARRLTGEAQ